MEPVSGLLGVIILVLMIWAVIKIVGSSASALSKAIWIVVILLLPVIGLVLWLLFGPKR